MKNRIRELRLAKSIKAKAFAAELVITVQSLSNIERCMQLPSVRTALKIARLLDIPVNELFIED